MRKLRSQQETYLDRLIRGEAPSDGQDEALAAFVDQAQRIGRIPADASVEASHMSAILETAQLFVEKGEPVARPASKAIGPELQASGLPKRRRKIVLSSLLATLASKIAAGGIAVAMAATGGLAAAGELPKPVQRTVANAAEVVGLDLPGGTEDIEEEPDELIDPIDDVDVTEDGTKSGKSSADDVHAAINATEPGPGRGKAVSEAARQKPATPLPTPTDVTEVGGTGSATSTAVHGAIEATEPGPERGKAVSEAASGGKAQGGGIDTQTQIPAQSKASNR